MKIKIKLKNSEVAKLTSVLDQAGIRYDKNEIHLGSGEVKNFMMLMSLNSIDAELVDENGTFVEFDFEIEPMPVQPGAQTQVAAETPSEAATQVPSTPVGNA